MRPADAYRARHRGPSPADAYPAKYRGAGSPSVQSALAGLRLVEGVASASLAGLPDDLWRRICAFARPATCARALVVAAGSNASLRQALCAEAEQTERSLFGMTRGEAEQILTRDGYDFLAEYQPGDAFHRALGYEIGEYPNHAGFGMWESSEPWTTMRLAQAFLAYGVDPDYARKLDGRTALMITPELASRGFKDAEALARLLIRCGADVHASHKDDWSVDCTPLVYAFRSLQINVPQLIYPTVRPSVHVCVGVAFCLLGASVEATSRSLRAHPRLYRDPGARFEVVQARILSQEENFMNRHGRRRFCEYTAEFLRLCEITVDGSLRHSLVAANLHYMTKVLTKIGLDREAVGEPEGLERTFANQSKELMFITQDAVRSRLRKLY